MANALRRTRSSCHSRAPRRPNPSPAQHRSHAPRPRCPRCRRRRPRHRSRRRLSPSPCTLRRCTTRTQPPPPPSWSADVSARRSASARLATVLEWEGRRPARLPPRASRRPAGRAPIRAAAAARRVPSRTRTSAASAVGSLQRSGRCRAWRAPSRVRHAAPRSRAASSRPPAFPASNSLSRLSLLCRAPQASPSATTSAKWMGARPHQPRAAFSSRSRPPPGPPRPPPPPPTRAPRAQPGALAPPRPGRYSNPCGHEQKTSSSWQACGRLGRDGT